LRVEEKELARIAQKLERQEDEQQRAAAAAVTTAATKATEPAAEVDWLKTRRSVFGDQAVANKRKASKPFLGGGDCDCPFYCISQVEILLVIQAVGGSRVQVMPNAHGCMGVGYDGMILVAATNSYQICSIAVALIRQLRLSKLGDCGVNGAAMGTKRKSFSSEQDCGNYELHIQSEQAARKFYQLERLRGDAADDPILQVDCSDEDAVAQYTIENPLPANSPYGYGNNSGSYLRLKNDRPKRNSITSTANQVRKKKKLNRWR